jgi:hypothetical protein
MPANHLSPSLADDHERRDSMVTPKVIELKRGCAHGKPKSPPKAR